VSKGWSVEYRLPSIEDCGQVAIGWRCLASVENGGGVPQGDGREYGIEAAPRMPKRSLDAYLRAMRASGDADAQKFLADRERGEQMLLPVDTKPLRYRKLPGKPG
jgi:hypothetical protein